MHIQIPFDLRPSSILGFSSDIDDLPDAGIYEFDFGSSRWFPPFSMLLLSIVLTRFRDSRPNSHCQARNHENHTYAAYLGFFRSFGLNHGNSPGAARGSENYVPIQRLSVEDLQRNAAERWIDVGEVVEAKARELTGVLTQTDSGALFDTLAYAIREIIRNTVEHSSSRDVFLCAQHWPSRQEVEVGIADSGIGVRQGLARNTEFRELDNRQAIQAALMPGVSGNPRAGRGANVWQNSGYGLYMTNRICRNGGNFLICSGGDGVEVTSSGKVNLTCKIPGTAVRLLLNTERLPGLREQLGRFRDEGQRAAQSIRGANRSLASTASQMLSADFNLHDS